MDFKRLRITLRTSATGSRATKALLEEIDTYAAAMLPLDVGVRATGNLVVVSEVSDRVLSGQIESLAQRLDELQTALIRSTRASWRVHLAEWQALRRRWLALSLPHRIEAERERVRLLHRRLGAGGKLVVGRKRDTLIQAETRLRLLSPQNVLNRGFSITCRADNGAVVRDSAELQTGQRLRTRLQRGEVQSEVVEPPDDA